MTLALTLPFPVELFCQIVDDAVYDNTRDSGSREIHWQWQNANGFGKGPWSDVHGLSLSCHVLRSITLRSWFNSISINTPQDWLYLTKHSILCSQVKETSIMKFTAFLDLFHIFPRLQKVRLDFACFTDQLHDRLLWLPQNLTELELNSPDPFTSFVLTIIASHFKRLKALRLAQTFGSPKLLDDVTNSICASNLFHLEELYHLAIAVRIFDPERTPTVSQTIDDSSRRIAQVLSRLRSISWEWNSRANPSRRDSLRICLVQQINPVQDANIS